MPINSARRTFLRCVGAGLTVAAVSTTVTAQESGWTEVPSPKDGALHDVVHTATGLYAVGDGGVVIKRTSEGWKTVFEDGPSSNGRNLLGAEVTDDGDRLWFVGKSGAVGVFDVQTDSLVADPSSPNDYTDNFNDVAVTGTAGQADVYVASNAGQIHYSFENGEDETWNETTVGEGNGIKAIDFHGDESGHAVTGNQTVFETSDGATYQKIGIADSDVDFFGIDSEAPDDVWVTGGSGTVYRWDGSKWTREQIGDPDRPQQPSQAGSANHDPGDDVQRPAVRVVGDDTLLVAVGDNELVGRGVDDELEAVAVRVGTRFRRSEDVHLLADRQDLV